MLDRHSWRKQMAAKIARNCRPAHLRHIADNSHLSDGDLLRSLERKFFLNRKEATALLNERNAA